MHPFKANIEIIGINPYVLVPEEILASIFQIAGKDKGPIPIHGEINGVPYKQTLMKFKGTWRLYINTFMLKNSPKRIGETIHLTVAFDPADRSLQPHPKFIKALTASPDAQTKFDSLRPSLQHEIIRYLSHLKTEESVERNIEKAIAFLLGKGRFVGREKP